MVSGQIKSAGDRNRERRHRRGKVRFALMTAAVAVVASRQALAADGTWSGTNSSTWADAGNWAPGVPGATVGTTNTDVVSFVTTPTTATLAVDAGRNISGFAFDTTTATAGFIVGTAGVNAGDALYLTGGGTIALEGVNPGAVQQYDLNAPMILAGSSYTFRNNAGDTGSTNGGLRPWGNVTAGSASLTTLTLDGDHGSSSSSRAEFYGAIGNGAGTVGVTKVGVGCWEMNQAGTNPNTYTGDTVVNAGLLRNGAAGGFDGLGGFSLNSHYYVNSGGTLRNTVTGASIGKVTVYFGGILNVSTSASTTLNFPINSGIALELDYTANTNSSDIAVSLPIGLTGTVAGEGGITVKATPGPTGTGRVSLGATGSTLNLGTVNRVFDIQRGADTNNYDTRTRGPIVGSGGIIKKGNGILQIDNTGNTFTGTIEVQAGDLRGSNTAGINNQFGGLNPLLVSGGNVHIYGGQTQTFGAVTVTKGSISASNSLSTLKAPSYAFNVGTGDAATIDAVVADATGASTVVKNGDGSATFTGALTYTGSTTVNAGTLSLGTDLTASPTVSVTGGKLELRTTAVPTRVIKANSVSVTGAGQIDLRHNKLITNSAIGTHNGTNYTGITGLVETGRNGGVWNGPGITTTMSDATTGSGYTMLGVASGSDALGIAPSDTTTWSGQTVTGTSTLVMYTYGGDANLSGFVDVDDYGLIDFNAALGGILTGWFNGDFDYNGFQDVDDYGIIDFVAVVQGPPFPTAGAGMSIAAVPEPTAACGLALLAGTLLHRRRR